MNFTLNKPRIGAEAQSAHTDTSIFENVGFRNRLVQAALVLVLGVTAAGCRDKATLTATVNDPETSSDAGEAQIDAGIDAGSEDDNSFTENFEIESTPEEKLSGEVIYRILPGRGYF